MSTEQTSLAVFDTLHAEVTLMVKPIMSIQVTDALSEANARSAGGQLAFLLKDLKRKEKELLAPLEAKMDAIKSAAKKVEAILLQPKTHIGIQLDGYAAELTRKRIEAFRIQHDREDAERKAAEEKRREEEAKLRAKQDAERKEREAAFESERARIQADLEARRMQAERYAADRAAAADLFGAGKAAQERVTREASDAKRAVEEQAAVERQAEEARAAADRKTFDDQQERERLAEQARLEREESERIQAADRERKEIEVMRVKGTKTEIIVEVLDAWSVPREFLRAPEVQINDVKKAFKAGTKEIPGLRITEEARVGLRTESVPSFRSLAGSKP